MELIALGVGGGWARAGGAACGYLLREGGFTLWVDAGTGTMANLQRHCALLDVDAVVISHRHFDHFLDLYPFWLALWNDPERTGKIPLYSPPGMFHHALKLEEKLADVFEPVTVQPAESFEVGPFRVRTARMRHPVPTLGMRIEADGRALAYSADTGPTDELVALANGADLLLAEATWLTRPQGWPMMHLTARECGQHAARAGTGALALTHIWPAFDREEARSEAGATFGGPVTAASENLRVAL